MEKLDWQVVLPYPTPGRLYGREEKSMVLWERGWLYRREEKDIPGAENTLNNYSSFVGDEV